MNKLLKRIAQNLDIEKYDDEIGEILPFTPKIEFTNKFIIIDNIVKYGPSNNSILHADILDKYCQEHKTSPQKLLDQGKCLIWGYTSYNNIPIAYVTGINGINDLITTGNIVLNKLNANKVYEASNLPYTLIAKKEE